MSDSLRSQMRAIAVKQETTAGTDAINGTPVTADWIGADFSYTLPQELIENMEANGSMDESAPFMGVLRGTVEIRMYLRGSGTAGTAPELGRLLQACGWAETLDPTGTGAAAAATAGTTTTVTGGTGFSATAQAYRGRPLLITGTPVAQSVITDYSASKVAALSDTFGAALTTAALLQVPPAALYRPGDDETAMKPVTVYLWEDDIRHRFTGMVGDFRMEWQAGKPAMVVFSLRGQVRDAYIGAALPAASLNIARATPPLWLGGKSQLGRAAAKVDSFKLSAGVSITEPDNPEAPAGFDVGTVVKRALRAELAPYANVTSSPGRLAAMTAGTSIPYAAILGSSAGNRFSLCMPSSRIVSIDRGQRAELGVDQLTLRPDILNAGAFLAAW